MKASVIIPTKNAGDAFKNVIDMVLKQEVPWPYEVLVIDSGSTDGTLEYCKTKEELKIHQIPPYEFGHGKTRNLGISITKGEFAVLITQDALPKDNKWLYELVTSADQDPGIAGSFGRHEAYSHDGPFIERDLKMHFDNFLNWPSTVVRLEDKERYDIDPGYRQFLHFYSNNNSCIRRQIWEKIPFPDVDFAEDQIWAKNIIEAGYSKAYCDKAVVYHSHSMGPWEQGKRSFDEAYALHRLFGYKLCPTIVHLFARSFHTTISDINYAIKRGIVLGNMKLILISPIRNIFHQIGLYLGERGDHLPEYLRNYFSRDWTLRKVDKDK